MNHETQLGLSCFLVNMTSNQLEAVGLIELAADWIRFEDIQLKKFAAGPGVIHQRLTYSVPLMSGIDEDCAYFVAN